MLTRRMLMAAGAATAAIPTLSREARAKTPANTLVMGKAIDDIVAMDPQQAYEFTSIEVGVNIYRKIVSPDLDNLSKIGPDLAEAWEVSSDGKTFTFHLTKDARFASGKPMTSADAEFSLHRAVILNLTPGFIITQFGFNKDNLTSKAQQALDQLAASISSTKGYIIALEGGTDSVGSADYNYDLSQRRANSVIQYLATKYNVPAHKIYVIGLGKDKPVESNKTSSGRADNRRVDVRLMTNTMAGGSPAAAGGAPSM